MGILTVFSPFGPTSRDALSRSRSSSRSRRSRSRRISSFLRTSSEMRCESRAASSASFCSRSACSCSLTFSDACVPMGSAVSAFICRHDRFHLTHSGLLFASFPTLIFETGLSSANRVDVAFGDVGRRLRAQVVQHLVAESSGSFPLQERRLEGLGVSQCFVRAFARPNQVRDSVELLTRCVTCWLDNPLGSSREIFGATFG